MPDRIQLACMGDLVEVYVDEDGDVVFDGWDERAEMAFIGFGDTERSPCWNIARAIDLFPLRQQRAKALKLIIDTAHWNNYNFQIPGRWLDILMMHGAEEGNIAAMDGLIDLGVDVDAPSPFTYSRPLHGAVAHGGTNAVKFLLKEGADVNEENDDGQTPLHYAAMMGNTDIAVLLLKRGVDFDIEDNYGKTALDYAKEEKHSKTFTLLTKWIVTTAVDEETLEATLFYNVKKGYLAVVSALIDAGADVNEKDDEGTTPLHFAARSGRTDTAKLLLENGANVNAISVYDGWTPLGLAIKNGHTATVALLKKWGAAMTKRIKLECMGDLVEMYIDENGDVIFDGWDKRAEMAFIGFGDTERSPCWIVARAIDDDRLDEALIEQAKKGAVDTVAVLIAAGAHVNETPFLNDMTALHMAAIWGHTDVAKLLLENGADVNPVDSWGDTPLVFAEENGHADMVILLRKWGGEYGVWEGGKYGDG